MICPICKNGDHVYHQGQDPIYKNFIMCSLHGIQVCDEKKIEQKTEREKE